MGIGVQPCCCDPPDGDEIYVQIVTGGGNVQVVRAGGTNPGVMLDPHFWPVANPATRNPTLNRQFFHLDEAPGYLYIVGSEQTILAGEQPTYWGSTISGPTGPAAKCRLWRVGMTDTQTPAVHNLVTLAAGLNDPDIPENIGESTVQGSAYNQAVGVFYVFTKGGNIYKLNTDGSGWLRVIAWTSLPALLTTGASRRDAMRDPRYDPTSDKIYWLHQAGSNYYLVRMSPSGGPAEIFLTFSGFDIVFDIDPGTYLYYTKVQNATTFKQVRRCDLTGLNDAVIYTAPEAIGFVAGLKKTKNSLYIRTSAASVELLNLGTLARTHHSDSGAICIAVPRGYG